MIFYSPILKIPRCTPLRLFGNYKLSCVWSFDSCTALRANLSAFILASSSRMATVSLGIFLSMKVSLIANDIFWWNIRETCAQDLGTTDLYTSSQNQLQPLQLPCRETYIQVQRVFYTILGHRNGQERQ